MEGFAWILAGFFLPLFPLSMGFNLLFARIRGGWPRALLLLAWPQVGVAMLTLSAVQPPAWSTAWAVGTAALYGLRALAVREAGVWTGFIATSSWAMLWVGAAQGLAPSTMHIAALGFGAPLALLVLLVSALERRFGAAYAGLQVGLALSLPRLSVLLVLVVLATTATPVFPAFSTMLAMVVAAAASTPATAVALVGVWVLWSWAGARLLQGLVVGDAAMERTADLDRRTTAAFSVALLMLAGAGMHLITGLA